MTKRRRSVTERTLGMQRMLPAGGRGGRSLLVAPQPPPPPPLTTAPPLVFNGYNMPYRAVQAPIDVTSSSFVGTWESAIGFVNFRAMRWVSQIGVDASTTGEAKLSVLGLDSGVYTLPAASLAAYTWDWLHQLDLGALPGTGALFQLLVRRTSGAGTIHVYAPDVVGFAEPADIGATSDGL